MNDWFLFLVSYFLGAIPFSYICGKYLGKVDISQRGSGNIGATNVLRSTTTSVAVLALAGDLLKGLLAAWIGLTWGNEVIAAVCGVLVVVGHCFSIFLSFKGGKGVATAAGVILYLMPQIFLVLLAVMILAVLLTRYVSLIGFGRGLVACFVPDIGGAVVLYGNELITGGPGSIQASFQYQAADFRSGSAHHR